MPAWIAFTFAAAFTQTLRFMVQKHLRGAGLSTAGATFSRFVFSAPLVACLLPAYAAASGQTLPLPGLRFWAFALAGGAAQILATMCVVALFATRNFATGMAFKKTEVMQTVLVSALVLGEGVGPAAAAAIAVGFLGVLLLSDPPGGTGPRWRRLANRASGLGLLSGVFFAISAVGYRGASLSLPAEDPLLRAGLTLLCVTTVQTLAMAAYMRAREVGEIGRVLRAWRVSGLVGLTSMLGSFCWFTAFTLENAAHVNAVGQVELVFSVAASLIFFRETITRREAAGIVLLLASIVTLVVVA
ncbi:DMT family transporter [Mesobaculum littorinae]|uniref:DMT family transporter n=1 Tax=Mesobaculum littorinae TaxID=2486419 RepID=A0A438AJP5_9RHOB|nr:DMT family transporter [Mesobaculum littorinae]RVV98825.1 DMT family transporter [Mesobaculum littorinae]